MEGLVMTMVVELPLSYGHCDVGKAIMMDAKRCCTELWIDGKSIPITDCLSMESDKPVHAVKYVFAPGFDYIPANAFMHAPSKMRIKSITLPDGLKTLKNSCFYHCHFEGNLILPDSLKRIGADALDCRVDGVFQLPSTVKYISSLPKSENGKPEIILPEGMLGFTPESIITDHLHIPSTLRECHPRSYYSNSWKVHRITIAPGNPYLVVRDDKLVSLIAEKREKLKKMHELSWNAQIDAAFSGTGLEIQKQYHGKTLSVALLDRQCLYFRLGDKMTPEKAQQAADIAGRFKALAESFSGEKAKLHLGRLYYVPQKKCLFFYAFNNDAVSIELSVEGGREALIETFNLSQRFFSLVTRQVKEVEKKYGRNHLHFSLIHN
jgi:hypothetical protein